MKPMFPNHFDEKREEKGIFFFGSSCLVMLFEKGHLVFDCELIENSGE